MENGLLGFQVKTRFVTPYGIRSFMNYSPDEEITIMDENTEWVQANVRKLVGKKLKYVVKCNNCTKEIECMKIPGIELAGNIPIPDYVVNMLPSDKEDCLFFAYGYALGLGREIEGYTVIKLSGNLYIPIFKKAGFTVGEVGNGEYELAIHGNIRTTLLNFKAYRFVHSFGKYWLSLGLVMSMCNGMNVGVYTAQMDLIEALADLSCLCGYHAVIPENRQTDNLGYIRLNNGDPLNRYWKVDSIFETGTSVLWGLENKNNNSVVLEGGILLPTYLKI